MLDIHDHLVKKMADFIKGYRFCPRRTLDSSDTAIPVDSTGSLRFPREIKGPRGQTVRPVKGASPSGQETPTQKAISRGTGSEFCVVCGNVYCEA